MNYRKVEISTHGLQCYSESHGLWVAECPHCDEIYFFRSKEGAHQKRCICRPDPMEQANYHKLRNQYT